MNEIRPRPKGVKLFVCLDCDIALGRFYKKPSNCYGCFSKKVRLFTTVHK